MVDKLPSNNDNNKTKYLIVRQNQHVANRLYITYMGNQASTFLFFVWKILDYHSFWLFRGQVSIFLDMVSVPVRTGISTLKNVSFPTVALTLNDLYDTTCIIQLVWLCKIVNSYKFDAQIFVLYNFSKIGWVLFLPTCMKKMRPITFEVSECWIILKKLLD